MLFVGRISEAHSADPARHEIGGLRPAHPPYALEAGAEAAHTHGIAAYTIVLEGAVSRLDFARALGGLAMDRGNDLLRVKGIVCFADRPERP